MIFGLEAAATKTTNETELAFVLLVQSGELPNVAASVSPSCSRRESAESEAGSAPIRG